MLTRKLKAAVIIEERTRECLIISNKDTAFKSVLVGDVKIIK